MRRRWLLECRWLLGLALPALLALSGCTPQATDYEQISPSRRLVARFSHVTAENSPKHLAALRFAEAAREAANGRVEIQVYPNSQLYKDWEEIDALRAGKIEFIAVAPSKLTEFDSAWQVFDLPFVFGDFADVERLFNSPPGQEMRAKLEERGLVALSLWPNGFKQFTNRLHPLVAPADFEGLTFRAQAGEVLQDQFAAVGARAVVSSFNTLFADIEQGKVDGQENTFNNIYTRNLHLVQPHLTISNHGFLAYVVLTRADWWESLDPEIQAALRTGLQEATQWVRANAQAINEESLEKLQATGRVTVHTLTEAERKALWTAFAPVYTGAAQRLGQDVMEQVLAATGADGAGGPLPKPGGSPHEQGQNGD